MNKIKKSYKLVIIIQYTSSQLVIDGLNIFNSKYNGFFNEFRIYYVDDIENGKISEDNFIMDLRTADLIMIDVRSNRITARILENELKDRSDVNVVVLLSAGFEIMKISRLGKFHLGTYVKKFIKEDTKEDRRDYEEEFFEREEKQKFDPRKIFFIQKMIKLFGTIIPFGGIKHSKRLFQMMDWWKSGEVENFICILELVSSKYMGLKINRRKKQKPKKYYDAAFWRPDVGHLPYKSKKYFKKYPLKPNLPTLLLLFYGGYHFDSSVAPVRLIFEKYKEKLNIIAFYTDGVFTTDYLKEYFGENKINLDAILSFLWFRFNGGPLGGDLEKTHKLLTNWKIPVFMGVGLYNQYYEDFLERKEGITPIQVMTSIIFPEMDGLIDPIPMLCNKSEELWVGNQKVDLVRTHVFEDNIDLMIKRITARVQLKTLKNSEKRIVLILYNYPPGESGIGNAAYFDSIRTICRLLKVFEENDYVVKIPNNLDLNSPNQLKDWFIENGFINSPKWTSLEKLVNKNVASLIKIPKEDYQNWFNNLDERLKKEVEKTWGKLPGNLQVIEDDIYIPLIKFGNIYLGLQPSRGDIEDVEKIYHDYNLPPHHAYLAFYYYISEKLKAHAIVHLGTHGTLEFLPGKEIGLKKEFCFNYSMIDYLPHFYIYQISNTSEAMIAKRRSLATLISYQLPPFIDSGLNSYFAELEEDIHLLKEAELMNNPTVEQNKNEILKKARKYGFVVSSIEELENEIIKCKTSLIPKGLHVIGDGYEFEDAVNYIFCIQSMIPHHPNLYELIADEFKLPKNAYHDLLSFVNENKEDKFRVQIRNICLDIIREILFGRSIEEIRNKFRDLNCLLDPNFPELVEKIRIIGKNSMKNYEIVNLINGLNGNYIPVSMGGDPIRTPNVLPSGFNIYQFNPQLIPTDLAMKRGYQAAEQTIELYRKEHNGEYPKNICIVLWGFETAKTHGEAVGQILAYLGVKLSDLKSWKREPELIPLSELGRPRINVTINICGFMRDLFSHVLELIDEAIDLVIDTEESTEMNYVRANYIQIVNDLKNENVNKKEIDFLARARIFGPDAAEYGTTLTTMIESGAWKSPEDLGNAYLNQMQYIYRKNIRARPSLKIFKKQLSSIDVISQIRDSLAYAITDLDHYYEFMGGLSQAAKISGKEELPAIYITDTTSIKVETTTVKTAINRGIITRTANPNWIKWMLNHDYSGGKRISNNVNYLLGFSATTNQVEDVIWDKVYESLIENEEIQDLMKKNNIYAFYNIVGNLLEAIKRNLWNASEDKENKLKELYLEMDGLIEK
ncbi:MAG: cobaltochelatase subunit CobN [Candidatus Helarchaeota archaeon]